MVDYVPEGIRKNCFLDNSYNGINVTNSTPTRSSTVPYLSSVRKYATRCPFGNDNLPRAKAYKRDITALGNLSDQNFPRYFFFTYFSCNLVSEMNL